MGGKNGDIRLKIVLVSFTWLRHFFLQLATQFLVCRHAWTYYYYSDAIFNNPETARGGFAGPKPLACEHLYSPSLPPYTRDQTLKCRCIFPRVLLRGDGNRENWTVHNTDPNPSPNVLVFAWEAYEKGTDVHLQADPTKLELLHREYKVKKEDFKQDLKGGVLEKVIFMKR